MIPFYHFKTSTISLTTSAVSILKHDPHSDSSQTFLNHHIAVMCFGEIQLSAAANRNYRRLLAGMLWYSERLYFKGKCEHGLSSMPPCPRDIYDLF